MRDHIYNEMVKYLSKERPYLLQNGQVFFMRDHIYNEWSSTYS